MSTFEEQFPTMAKTVFYHGTNEDRIKVVPVMSVKVHCLEKQKVREAWKKYDCGDIDTLQFKKELEL